MPKQRQPPDNAKPASDLLVVEIRRRGKLVVGDPAFVPGVPIVIDRRGLGAADVGDLAVVRTRRGRAQIERVLGPADRIEAVLEAHLEQAGETGATEPYDTPAPSMEDRVDLRGLTTVTIDPETAKDFDDAISVERDGEQLRAYIHIADVSHFVAPGTPLDRGAMARAVSVYVPGRVAPMLPPELADDLCSLRPNEDRPTVTVEIPFDTELNAGTPTFYRSVIRSDARLSYGEAERMLAGNGTHDPGVTETVVLAERIAGELRRRRFARGALRVESPEAAFSFDGDGGIADGWLDAEPAAHALVEELMILANEAVAGFLADRRAETLYRVHESPEAQSIIRLATALAELGVPTPPTPEAESLTPRAAALLAGEISERVQAYVGSSGRGRFAFPHSSCAHSSRRATTRRTSATPASRAPPTAISRRRSAATRISCAIARCFAPSAQGTIHRRTTSARRRSRSRRANGWQRGGVRRRRDLPRVAPRRGGCSRAGGR